MTHLVSTRLSFVLSWWGIMLRCSCCRRVDGRIMGYWTLLQSVCFSLLSNIDCAVFVSLRWNVIIVLHSPLMILLTKSEDIKWMLSDHPALSTLRGISIDTLPPMRVMLLDTVSRDSSLSGILWGGGIIGKKRNAEKFSLAPSIEDRRN